MARKKKRQGRIRKKLVFKKRVESELPIHYYLDASIDVVWNAYYKDHDNTTLRDVLIERYRGTAKRMAEVFFNYRMPQHSLSSLDDLISQAMLGLIDAVEKYDPIHNVPFGIYLRLRVTGTIIDGLRTLQDYPRMIAKQKRELKPLRTKLTQKLGREPTNEDMCNEYGEELRPILEDPLMNSGVFTQLQAESHLDDQPRELLDAIPDDRPVFLSTAEAIDAETKILSIFDDVGRPDLRVVIYGYYFMRCTNSQIALAEGYSISTAVSKHKQALKVLKENLTKEEFKEIIGK